MYTVVHSSISIEFQRCFIEKSSFLQPSTILLLLQISARTKFRICVCFESEAVHIVCGCGIRARRYIQVTLRSPDSYDLSPKILLRTCERIGPRAQSFRFLSLHCTHPRPQASMSAPSLTHFITKRPWLKRWMTPLAHWYADAAGYRKLGLRYF